MTTIRIRILSASETTTFVAMYQDIRGISKAVLETDDLESWIRQKEKEGYPVIVENTNKT